MSNVLDLFDDETVVKIINEYNSVGEDHDLIVYEGSLSEIPSKMNNSFCSVITAKVGIFKLSHS